ncbi:MAG: GerAB/ArcD/ProY family transporter [Bacillus sp. (in: firmicutes)]
MNILQSNQLTLSQLFFFMIHAQVGLSILSLPYDLSNTAGHDGWMSIIIAIFFVQLMVFLYYYLMNRFPDLTFYDVTIKVFGSNIGKCLNYIIISYYLIYSAHFAYQCTTILKLWNYYQTPFWFMILILIFIGFYIIKGDLSPIGRFLTLATIAILSIIYFLFWDMSELNYHYILPLAEAKLSDIVKASREGIVAFSGFEILMFIHPFVQSSNKKKFKIANISIWAVCALYLVTTVFVYMYFPNSAKNIADPTIYFVIPMHFTAIQRIEVFFIAAWTVLMITSHICFLYIGLLGLSRTRKKKHHNHYAKGASILIFLVVIVAHRFVNEHIISIFKTYLMYFTFVVIFVIPFLTVIFNQFIRKNQKGETHNET